MSVVVVPFERRRPGPTRAADLEDRLGWHQGLRRPDSFYAWVAGRYERLVAGGAREPLVALAATIDVPLWQARRHVDTARARGLLAELRGSREEAPRLSFAALEAALGWPGTGRLARRLRVSGATVHGYRAHGLSVWRADVLATRAGLHPGEVWGADWSRTGLDDEEPLAA